jgi:hypothetical protein
MNDRCRLGSPVVQPQKPTSRFSVVEDWMRKLAITVSALALLGFGAPAMAHGWDGGDGGWESPHDRQHDRLDQRHDNVHEQLDEEHAEAHEEGLTPWEHAQLHRDLAYQHESADRQIRREHRREHRRSGWERRWNYGSYYDGY